MTRTKLADRVLPDYSKGQEMANMTTHIVGAAFGIVALILCVIFAAKGGDPYRIVGGAVYGTSLIFLYTVSSVYHGLHPNMGKKVMQVIDHCTIYFLIGGTYTPIVIGPLREVNAPLSWLIFSLVWFFCILASIFTAIDLKKYEKFSMVCYVGIGWVIILAIKPVIEAVSLNGMLFLVYGGVSYTVGAVLYKLADRKGKLYFHSIFHVFVLFGTIFHFFTVFIYCMN